MNDKIEPAQARTQTVKLRYETTDVSFVSQFLLNRSKEEIIVNCSPGYLPDPQGGGTIMPINNRIALTLPGAKRLAETLLKALEDESKSDPQDGAAVLPGLD